MSFGQYQPGVVKNGYRIIKLVGRGNFGCVFSVSKGQDLFAMKVVSNTGYSVSDFSQIKKLRNPCLVNYFDVFSDEDNYFFIMDLCDKGDLGGEIKRMVETKCIPSTARILETFGGVALGLYILHENHIIHRDLKPANIFEENKIFKIGGFEASQIIESGNKGHAIVGTPAFVAPEVLTGKYSYPCDIYSFGATLYNFIALRAYNPQKPEPIKSSPTIPLDVLHQVELCLSVNPSLRPTMEAIVLTPSARGVIEKLPAGTVPASLAELYRKTPIPAK